eukprot:TRINITY_DN1905_c0_g1_i4.p1 TRINITY_DN1905_c0_g1~~TRINITY_DN1905_c0_g1_i4.p1  ORF type:complete len:190 (-),score=42.97 TRINITY_DN1905_c0_g1_i4:325-894(-)
MCIRDRYQRRVHGRNQNKIKVQLKFVYFNIFRYKMAEQEKKKGFDKTKKFIFRGKNIEDLLKIASGETPDQIITPALTELLRSRIRRKISRGIKSGFKKFVRKVLQTKKVAPQGEKPAAVKTHRRDYIVVPAMIGSVIGIYNGKEFVNVEIKFDMIGRYLGEFAMSYKPTKHGKPGIGATKGSQHMDKK